MNDVRGSRRNTLLLALILLLYAALALAYGLSTPLFEAPDEHHHFFAVRYIAENGRLPAIETGGELARQEAAQPPLYYLLAAPILALVDTSGVEDQLWFNPTVINGQTRPINVNDFVHTELESWPWQGYALAAHLVRFLSALIGLGTLLAVYGSGRLLWPLQPGIALLATALVAFLPQFGFLHGAITNDVLIIFLASFVLWQLLWMWKNQADTVHLLLLGITIGLAVLSKMAGLGLLALSLLVLTLIAWRDRQATAAEARADTVKWLGELLWSGLLVVLPALLLSGWLLWRNWTLYGDVTAVNQFVAMAGKNRQYTLRQVWHDMDRVALSAIGYFGWMNVIAPRWLYLTWAAILALAGGGWLGTLWRYSSQSRQGGRKISNSAADNLTAALWMGAWVVIVFAAWLRFMMQTPADQGRLLFPALLPIALFVARGLYGWRLPWLPPTVAAAALFTSAYAALVFIPGIYNPAAIVSGKDIPVHALRPAVEMAPGIELLAVDPQTSELGPGEWAWVDLYWRAADPPADPPYERLGLYGREGALAGSQRNYHGGGTFPANLWPAGQIVKDSVAVQLAPDARLPAQLRLLLRIDDAYEPLEIARFKAVPAVWPQASGAALARFGGQIELMDATIAPGTASPGSEVIADVQWRVVDAPRKELTTFFHLGDPSQAPLAQGDGPALSGDYPLNLWADGEVINDRYALTLPEEIAPGRYPLHIGFYDPQSGERLSVQGTAEVSAFDAYLLGFLTVPAQSD